MAEVPAESSGRLDGWKEIAAYLRRSERSAQRYAADNRLPVHSRPLGRGHMVFAYTQELDDWMRRHDNASGAATVESGDSASGVVTGPVAGPGARQGVTWPVRTVLGGIAGALAIGLLGGVILVQPRAGSSASPARFAFVGQTFLAHDGAGRTMWSHDFGREVSEAANVVGVSVSDPVVARTDLDGNGSPEIVVPVRFGSRGHRAAVSDALFVFSNDGRVKSTITPPESLPCTTETFAAPWVAYAVAIAEPPGRRKIWVAFNHHTWWPGLVIEADPDGVQRVRYVQTGWIRALALWTTPSASYLVAGGVTNEQQRPILSVIDLSGPPVANPVLTASARFACDGVPTERPTAVYVLPNEEIGSLHNEPYSMVTDIRALGSSVKATATSARGGQIVQLSSDLRLTDYWFPDAHWIHHRELEQAGRITHTADQCPERLERRVRSWTSLTGWQEQVLTPRLGAATR